MYTIGTDLTTISRIEKSLSRQSFAQFVYGQDELNMFFRLPKPKYASLAANYAAKEAFSKALGTGVRNFNLNEVQVLRSERGQPYFAFSGRALDIILKGGYTAKVSLSHEGDLAMATVLLEKSKNIINI